MNITTKITLIAFALCLMFFIGKAAYGTWQKFQPVAKVYNVQCVSVDEPNHIVMKIDESGCYFKVLLLDEEIQSTITATIRLDLLRLTESKNGLNQLTVVVLAKGHEVLGELSLIPGTDLKMLDTEKYSINWE